MGHTSYFNGQIENRDSSLKYFTKPATYINTTPRHHYLRVNMFHTATLSSHEHEAICPSINMLKSIPTTNSVWWSIFSVRGSCRARSHNITLISLCNIVSIYPRLSFSFLPLSFSVSLSPLIPPITCPSHTFEFSAVVHLFYEGVLPPPPV